MTLNVSVIHKLGQPYGRPRREYSVSKRLVKPTRFQCLPLQLSGYEYLPPLSFALRYYL